MCSEKVYSFRGYGIIEYTKKQTKTMKVLNWQSNYLCIQLWFSFHCTSPIDFSRVWLDFPLPADKKNFSHSRNNQFSSQTLSMQVFWTPGSTEGRFIFDRRNLAAGNEFGKQLWLLIFKELSHLCKLNQKFLSLHYCGLFLFFPT